MTGTVKKLLAVALPITKGELVVLPQPEPTLAELTEAIRKGHAEVVASLINGVVNGLDTGKALLAAKKRVGHGNFADYVAMEFPFTMRAAQNYMKLARHEDKVRQMLTNKSEGRSYLTISEALKLIDTLAKKPKRYANR